MKPLRLLVPVNQTHTSSRILDAVEGITNSAERSVIELLHVEPLKDGAKPDDWRSLQMQAEEFLAQRAAAVAGPSVETACRVEWGDPADVIMRRSTEGGFDFVCMMTRAIPDGSDRPDSVAARLFHECAVPVIALPMNQTARADANQANRAYYRAPVYLPATLEAEGFKHPVKATVRDLGAKGAELETDAGETIPAEGCLLVLPLPTRPEPLELAIKIVHSRRSIGESQQEVQLLNATFPSVRIGQEDAIVAFINRLRVLEQQQCAVSAPVRVEVVTGPRSFATFSGHTTVVRPDYVWLRMEHFDHIETADVSLRVLSANGKEKIEVDGTVTSVKPAGDEFDAEVELAGAAPGRTAPGERLMSFLRQHYREAADGTAAPGQALIPRPIRAPRWEQPVARVATAAWSETSVPMRTPKKAANVPFEKRAKEAEEHAMAGILKPRRKSAPLRSL
jgi:hypothetical protein